MSKAARAAIGALSIAAILWIPPLASARIHPVDKARSIARHARHRAVEHARNTRHRVHRHLHHHRASE
jgi:hypothetical protein